MSDSKQRALHTSARAFADLYEKVHPSMRKAFGLVHRPLAGGTLLAASSLDHILLNRLVAAAVSGIDEAVATYRSLGVSRYLLTFDQEIFGEALERGTRHGLVRFRRPWATLLRDEHSSTPVPEQTAPKGILIREARAKDAEALGALLASAFDLPPAAAPIFAAAVDRSNWVAFVAESRQEIAGAGLLFLYEGCAYLAGGATSPAYRRRGIQRALVAARVRWAMAEGARIICSETGVALPSLPNSSWDNLVRAGLQPVDLREHLCPSDTSWSSNA